MAFMNGCQDFTYTEKIFQLKIFSEKGRRLPSCEFTVHVSYVS